jgi:Flp pilus assembly pilin Flp
MNGIDTNTTAHGEQSPSRQEAGQALAEYALILAFVSITAVALTPVGQWVAVRLTDLAAAL